MYLNNLQAGRAWRPITPAAQTHLAGSGQGNLRMAQSVMDPLHAKALVLESGGRRIGFLALDVTIITAEYSRRIRAAAREQCGIDPDAMMVHATQTHSAPALGYFLADRELWKRIPPEREYILGGQQAYAEMACKQAVEALKAATADLQPVRIGFSRATRLDLAFNRRAVRRDGTVTMPGRYHQDANPVGPTHLQYLEGPTDPEIGVLALQAETMEMLSMILHYTCHPVSVFCAGLPVVSADWPGEWCAGMQKRYGSGCKPLVLNGCCGDTNPWPPFEPGFILDHQRQAGELAKSALAAVNGIRFQEQAEIDYRRDSVNLPIRTVEPELLSWAEKMLSDYPRPKPAAGSDDIDPDWIRAMSVMSVETHRRREPVIPYEIQVFRIGETAVVGLAGEPFAEGQLQIKVASPAPLTIVAHGCTHYVGYLPFERAFPRGGHEVNTSYWAKVCPGALETVTAKAIAMIKAIFKF